MREVVALEEQRMPGCARKGVGKAVADVQGRRVPAFAICAEGADRQNGLLGVPATTSAPVRAKKRSSRSRPGSPFRPSITQDSSTSVTADTSRIDAPSIAWA